MIKLLLTLALIMLAACNKGPKVNVDSPKSSEVSEMMRPGKWLSTVTLQELTIPDMPPEFAARMKEEIPKQSQQESCLTPEEAKRPKGDFFATMMTAPMIISKWAAASSTERGAAMGAWIR